MIPAPESENLPTSQPKKTGCPALIIYTYKVYEFQVYENALRFVDYLDDRSFQIVDFRIHI